MTDRIAKLEQRMAKLINTIDACCAFTDSEVWASFQNDLWLEEPEAPEVAEASFEPSKGEHKLCYVEHGQRAYFTRLPLDAQWGDDWNDAPYEHNAGSPYNDDGADIVMVFWEGSWFQQPGADQLNSGYSVESINKGAAPWLFADRGKDSVSIPAGTSLEEFKRLIRADGGEVYVKED